MVTTPRQFRFTATTLEQIDAIAHALGAIKSDGSPHRSQVIRQAVQGLHDQLVGTTKVPKTPKKKKKNA